MVALACGSCGSSSHAVEVHHVDGVVFYTKDIDADDPQTGTGLRGSFTIENGCVVFRYGHILANPVFVPKAQLSKDRRSISIPGIVISLDGSTMTFEGELLSAPQVRNLGYDRFDDCSPSRFVFVSK